MYLIALHLASEALFLLIPCIISTPQFLSSLKSRVTRLAVSFSVYNGNASPMEKSTLSLVSK